MLSEELETVYGAEFSSVLPAMSQWAHSL